MADAKALYTGYLQKFKITNQETRNSEWGNFPEIYSACIIAEAITNNRDAICQSIDALTAAIKESGQ